MKFKKLAQDQPLRRMVCRSVASDLNCEWTLSVPSIPVYLGARIQSLHEPEDLVVAGVSGSGVGFVSSLEVLFREIP